MANQSKKKKHTVKQDSPSELTVGSRLLRARESLQLNINDIAEALKLSVFTLQEIENNNFSALHGDVFVRNYIKAYANEVRLDADELLQMYIAQVQTVSFEKPQVAATHSRQLVWPKRQSWPKLAVLAVVSIIGLALLIFPENSDETLLHKTDAVKIQPKQSDKKIDEPVDSNLIPAKDASVEASNDQSLLSVDTSDAEVVAVKPTQPFQPPTMNFQFSADCWVEIRDGNDERLHASLKKSGDNLELSGKPPFQITLGYAPGVSLSYNGDPVVIDVEPSHNKLTKLVLGNT